MTEARQRRRASQHLRTLPPWQRWLILIAVLLAFDAWPIYDGWRAAHAERTTIHVTSCAMVGKSPACRGTWSLSGGRPGHGQISGYESLTSDVDLHGWATGSDATTELLTWLIAPFIGAVVTLSLVLGIPALLLIARSRRRRRAADETGRPSDESSQASDGTSRTGDGTGRPSDGTGR
jgi:hypothetical protein